VRRAWRAAWTAGEQSILLPYDGRAAGRAAHGEERELLWSRLQQLETQRRCLRGPEILTDRGRRSGATRLGNGLPGSHALEEHLGAALGHRHIHLPKQHLGAFPNQQFDK